MYIEVGGQVAGFFRLRPIYRVAEYPQTLMDSMQNSGPAPGFPVGAWQQGLPTARATPLNELIAVNVTGNRSGFVCETSKTPQTPQTPRS